MRFFLFLLRKTPVRTRPLQSSFTSHDQGGTTLAQAENRTQILVLTSSILMTPLTTAIALPSVRRRSVHVVSNISRMQIDDRELSPNSDSTPCRIQLRISAS